MTRNTTTPKVQGPMIPLSEPYICGNEWKYVKDCLDTGWVSSAGSFVSRFEKGLADYCKLKHAVATANGTAALHLSLLAIGLRKGDEVIVPALTFIAPVNTVRYCGAHPVFLDCDPDSLCLSAEKFSAFIKKNTVRKEDGFTYNKRSGRRIKAVIPVHIFGHPADMNSIRALCRKASIEVIEDATESLGSQYRGRKTGSFGSAGCFSFNGNKIITTGGGGMIVTDDSEIAEKARHLSTQAKKNGIEYDHDCVGYNYRLTNVAAAIGVAQLERLEEFIKIKRENALFYRNALSGIPGVDFLWEQEGAQSNFWFYTIRVSRGHKDAMIRHLIGRNIQVRPIWKLIHTLPMYRRCETQDLTNAREAYERCINIPCSVNLTFEARDTVVRAIKDYWKKK